MNRDELLKTHEMLCAHGRELMSRKNHDYAGGRNADQDAFANFRGAEHFNICSVEKGILTRMVDKAMRLSNLLNSPAQVKDESIEDTGIDLINYTVILLAYLRSKRAAEPCRLKEQPGDLPAARLKP